MEVSRAWSVRPSEFDTWSDQDQAEACGWLEYERSLCDGCRQKRDEAADPWRAWSVEKDYICQGCRSLAVVEGQRRKKYEKHPEALYGWRPYIVGSRKIDPLTLV